MEDIYIKPLLQPLAVDKLSLRPDGYGGWDRQRECWLPAIIVASEALVGKDDHCAAYLRAYRDGLISQ